MNRREFLSATLGAAGVLAARKAHATTSIGGLLQAGLEAKYGRMTLAGRSATLFSFNGQVPGPALEAKPGDTARLYFTNSLPSATNIHFHGLHIPPTTPADNSFLTVPRGGSFTYEFTIPSDHPAGLFWFHPHTHPNSAQQAGGGMAALFLIRGDLDAIPEVAAATEQFIVLQDFALNSNGTLRQQTMMDRMNGREGSLITVNGQVNPALTVQRNGLARLRILNASPSRYYRLALEDHPLHLIATDGGSLPAPVALDEILLAPGERCDVLVKGDRAAGAYRLLNLAYDRGRMSMGGMMGGGMMGGMMGGSASQPSSTTLATLVYSGQASSPVNVPSHLIELPVLPNEPAQRRRFVLGESMMAFTIDGKTFNPDHIDTRVKLNTIEEWTFVNPTDMDHPIHLHTNSFQVIGTDGNPRREWKDTLNVRRGTEVRFLVRFDHFAGRTLYHCHILDHADMGMMAVVSMD